MVRQIAAVGLTVLALLAFAIAPAMADRLGGAYRGPYQDNTRDKEVPETDATESGGGSAPPGSGGGGEEGGGGAEEGGGGTDDGLGGGGGGEEGGGEEGGGEDPGAGTGGGEEGGGEGGGEGSPPPGAGDGSTGGGTSDPGTSDPADKPTGPGDGGSDPSGGSGLNLSGGRSTGKVAQEDVFAYWPFWFEHNKEWVLHEHLRSRGGGVNVTPGSSVWYFAGGDGTEKRVPIDQDMRKNIVLPILIEASNHGNPWVRDAAVIALGKLGMPEVVAPLVERVRKDKDVDIRQDALLALGLSGQKEALNPLLDAMADRDLKGYAALGLALLGQEEALPTLLTQYKAQQRSRDKETAACIAVALGNLGDEKVVNQLAAPLKSSRGDNHLKVYVCHSLGKIGGVEAKKWLLRALSSRDQGVQAAAVLALAGWSDVAVVRELKGRDGLKSGNRMAQLFALVSLGRIGSQLEAKDPKRKSILTEVRDCAQKPQKDKYRAMYGAISLALMGDQGASAFFMEMLEGDNRRKYSAENHSAMALAAGLLNMSEIAGDLREIVSRKTYEADYRGYAAFALGILGHTKSRDLVKGLLQEGRQKHEVLRSGAWALGLLGGPSDVDTLIAIIRREGPGLHMARGAASLAIGLAGDASSVDKLIKLTEEGGDARTHAFALAAMGCLVDSSDHARLSELFGNSHYRREFGVVKEVMSIL